MSKPWVTLKPFSLLLLPASMDVVWPWLRMSVFSSLISAAAAALFALSCDFSGVMPFSIGGDAIGQASPSSPRLIFRMFGCTPRLELRLLSKAHYSASGAEKTMSKIVARHNGLQLVEVCGP